MKKLLTLVLALALVLCQTACGQTAPAPGGSSAAQMEASQSTPAQSAQSAQSAPDAAANDGARAQTDILTVTLEGMEEKMPATLYSGEGWSIYIPDDLFEPADVDTEDAEVSWDTPPSGIHGELNVKVWNGFTAAEAQQALLEDEDDYTFADTSTSPVYGADAKDAQTLAAWVFQDGGMVCTVTTEYPDAVAEGLGARLAAVVGTFQLDQP